MALGYDVPDLFLAGMVIADGKGHQLFQLHAVQLIDIQQLVGHGHETQALFDYPRQTDRLIIQSHVRLRLHVGHEI